VTIPHRWPLVVLLGLEFLFELIVPRSLDLAARDVVLALLGVVATALFRHLRDRLAVGPEFCCR
jgi:hypothetical protein